MDENVKISDLDRSLLKNSVILNSTEKFGKGEADEILTFFAKKEGWVIVTKDIRMALRSLIDGVSVIFISDDFKTIRFLVAHQLGVSEFQEMYDYLAERFQYNIPKKI